MAEDNKIIFSMNRVGKTYPPHRQVLKDISLSFFLGAKIGIIGLNGSGKSTVLNLLAGLLTPDEGEITLNGRILFSGADNRSVPPEERNIGYVFQNYALFPHMTVLDNVGYGLMVKSVAKAQRDAKAEEALALVALPGFGQRRNDIGI